ncbi:MAG: hypothetical protein ACTSUE_03920 [Promethearchaeota archaeon]
MVQVYPMNEKNSNDGGCIPILRVPSTRRSIIIFALAVGFSWGMLLFKFMSNSPLIVIRYYPRGLLDAPADLVVEFYLYVFSTLILAFLLLVLLEPTFSHHLGKRTGNGAVKTKPFLIWKVHSIPLSSLNIMIAILWPLYFLLDSNLAGTSVLLAAIIWPIFWSVFIIVDVKLRVKIWKQLYGADQVTLHAIIFVVVKSSIIIVGFFLARYLLGKWVMVF